MRDFRVQCLGSDVLICISFTIRDAIPRKCLLEWPDAQGTASLDWLGNVNAF